jgi:hypothetical protein
MQLYGFSLHYLRIVFDPGFVSKFGNLIDFISGNRLNVRPESDRRLLVDVPAHFNTARNGAGSKRP